MNAQILLQGRLVGGEEFLAATPERDNRAFDSRAVWLGLLGEILPRALLAELGLPTLLLGASGGDRFVVILPDPARAEAAGVFLSRASDALQKITGNLMWLAWSSTENLGDWTIIRKRLAENVREGAHFGPAAPGFFDPFDPSAATADPIPRDLRDATGLSWNFESPALILAVSEDAPTGHSWTAGPDGEIWMPRHAVRNGENIASVKDLAHRSRGRKLWGVLRGEIDDFAGRMRRAQTVEEYAVLATLYKQRIGSDIQVLCSQPEYFQRVTLLECGVSRFTLYGAWESLAGFARELQAMFTQFAANDLRELPGGEGRTLTMALSLAESGDGLPAVWAACGRELAAAQASDKDCLHILGRVLEWKQVQDAADLKDTIVQINDDFRGGAQFIARLRSLYRKVEIRGANPFLADDQGRLVERALRFQRRFARVASKREREFQKLRSHLMKEVAGHRDALRKSKDKLNLRPEGLVAIEWAEMTEN